MGFLFLLYSVSRDKGLLLDADTDWSKGGTRREENQGVPHILQVKEVSQETLADESTVWAGFAHDRSLAPLSII